MRTLYEEWEMLDSVSRPESALDYSSRRIVAADLIIKAVGILLAIFIYPPITMFAVILAGCVVTFLPHVVNRKNKKRGKSNAV